MISNSYDQTKLFRVLLWIDHNHLWMEPEETWKYANSAFNNSNHTVLDALLFRFNLNLINNVFLHLMLHISRTSDPAVKVNSIQSLTASTLLHRLFLLSVCFIYPMSGRYSKNWDRKGWPGSEIQMYYGCPWFIRLHDCL